MPRIKPVTTGLLCLCAALSLTACSTGGLITRTELIEKPVRQYVDIPVELTAARPEPAKPAPACQEGQGKPVLCNRQLLDWIDALREALGLANADKQRIGELSERVVEPIN